MTHATLIRFVLISLLAHAGLLLSWPKMPPPPVTAAAGGAPLQLALEAPGRDMARQSPPSSSRAAPESTDERESAIPETLSDESRSGAENTAVRPVIRQVEPGIPALSDPRTPAGNSNAGDRIVGTIPDVVRGEMGEAEVRVRIGEAVETHFYYPPLARRRGWEGEVVVGVHVDGDGRLSAIDVVASSGYRVLDSAAVDSLTRLARLPDAGGLPATGIVVRVPVRYRLVDRPA